MTYRVFAALSFLLVICACGNNEATEGNGADNSLSQSLSTSDSAESIIEYRDADYKCHDGLVEIAIYYTWNAMLEESDNALVKPVMSNENRIIIKTADSEFAFENVLALTDGAGNDTFQVLAVKDGRYEIITELHYDHEDGFLTGYYSLPNFERYPFCRDGEDCEYVSSFTARTNLVPGTMDCYTHTFEGEDFWGTWIESSDAHHAVYSFLLFDVQDNVGLMNILVSEIDRLKQSNDADDAYRFSGNSYFVELNAREVMIESLYFDDEPVHVLPLALFEQALQVWMG